MKKLTRKRRERDARANILFRKGKKVRSGYRVNANQPSGLDQRPLGLWIKKNKDNGLNIRIDKGKKVTIFLPEEMNFFDAYNETSIHILAIRKFSNVRRSEDRTYRLASVNFDDLKSISTSAALVLTAELSKWDDAIRQQLTPMVDNWDKEILKQFTDLGFFDLFNNCNIEPNKEGFNTPINLVKYIKGRCGDNCKIRTLKKEIVDVIGEELCKWSFLHGGVTEAITNVSHHAYPDTKGYSENDKNWYLTGSYNEDNKELKIVFYDQGIGIPNSLPASHLWEKILTLLSSLPAIDRKRDEVLLKAAIELERTSTGEMDRGKGLQDLLEFIRQRENGHLSILSLKGLFKYSMLNGREKIKTEHFSTPICGTLIIWSATLHG